MTETTPPALAQLLTDDEPDVIQQIRVGMPPLAERLAGATVRDDLPNLSSQIKALMLIARGGAGKTLLARWLADTALARGTRNLMLAALDPINRTLADFYPGTMQPTTADAGDTFNFLLRMLRQASNRRHLVMDFGGGDLSLARLIGSSQGLENTMRLQGVALVPTYVLTPSVDDLAMLTTHAEAGFQPKTTLLVLNLGRADGLADFARVRGQAAYQQAVERGAVEIVMPRLDGAVARALEGTMLPNGRRPHFIEGAAEDAAVVGGLQAMLLRNWLAECRAAFAPVETWMPWG